MPDCGLTVRYRCVIGAVTPGALSRAYKIIALTHRTPSRAGRAATPKERRWPHRYCRSEILSAFSRHSTCGCSKPQAAKEGYVRKLSRELRALEGRRVDRFFPCLRCGSQDGVLLQHCAVDELEIYCDTCESWSGTRLSEADVRQWRNKQPAQPRLLAVPA
jgi:hypothetical protein